MALLRNVQECSPPELSSWTSFVAGIIIFGTQ
jgi:hypothetical protein